MLAIRMQRTGRKGHAMFRVVVQDARRTPTSGKVVARLGSYDPHAKTVTLDKEKASFYLEHGAQPSGRVVVLLKQEGVKLPEWVQEPAKKESTVRNADKRRSTRPEEPVEEAAAEPAAVAAETATPEAEAEPAVEVAPTEEKPEAEAPAEESADASVEEESATAEPDSTKPAEEVAETSAEPETETEK
jgi:small subunit ribosomal protein S16